MERAVIPWRRFRNKSVAKLALTFLLAAVAARILKYHVHRSLPRRDLPSGIGPAPGCSRGSIVRQRTPGPCCDAEDLSFRMIFWALTHTGRRQFGLSSDLPRPEPQTVRLEINFDKGFEHPAGPLWTRCPPRHGHLAGGPCASAFSPDFQGQRARPELRGRRLDSAIAKRHARRRQLLAATRLCASPGCKADNVPRALYRTGLACGGGPRLRRLRRAGVLPSCGDSDHQRDQSAPQQFGAAHGGSA